MLPCRPSDKSQLEAKIDWLRKEVPYQYLIGLEVGMTMDELFDPNALEKIKTNLEEVAESVFLTLHGAIELEIGSNRNFFQSETGFQGLVRTFQFAKEIGANLVTIHAHKFLTYAELKKASEANKLEEIKITSLQKVREYIQRLNKEVQLGQKICIENVPYCLLTDWNLNPEESLFELIFVDPKDIEKLADLGVSMTIDTDHLAQVYDSSQLLPIIQKLGTKLAHVHASDVGETYNPFINLASEGTTIGKGRIGEKGFKELLGYFLKFSEKKYLGIVIEVRDIDHIKSPNSIESLRRVIRILDELEKH